MFCISRISDGPERCQLPQLSLLLVESLQTEQLNWRRRESSANIRLDDVDLTIIKYSKVKVFQYQSQRKV